MRLKQLFLEATGKPGLKFAETEEEAEEAFKSLFGKWSFGAPNARWNKYDKAYHVMGDITILDFVGKQLPVRLHIVTGVMKIEDCPNLETLEGCPAFVGGHLTLSGLPALKNLQHIPATSKILTLAKIPQLTSLRGMKAAGSMEIRNCDKLKSFDGIPDEVSNLYLTDLPLTSLEGIPLVKEMLGLYELRKLTSLAGIPDSPQTLTVFNCDKVKTLEHAPRNVNVLNVEEWDGSLVGIADYFDQLVEIDLSARISGGGLGLLLLKEKGLTSMGQWQNLPEQFQIIHEYLWSKEKEKDDIFDCQQELIERGFEEYAQL